MKNKTNGKKKKRKKKSLIFSSLLLITQRPRIFLNSFIKSIILCSTSSKQIYSLWSRASGGEGHGKRHFHHPFLFVLFLFSFLPPFFLVHSDSFSYFVAWRTRERQSLNFTSCCLILFTLVTCNTIVACLPILNVLRAGTLHTLPSCLNLPAGRLTMPQTWPSLSTQPLEPSEHHSPHHAPTRNRESHCPGLPEDVIEATVEELAKSPCCWKGSPGPEGKIGIDIISHGVEVMARSLWGSCQGPITGVCVHTNIDPSENDFSVWGLCMTYSSENGNTVWGKMANRFSETQFREIHWPPFMSSLSVAICVVDKSRVLEKKIKINAKELFSFSFLFLSFSFSFLFERTSCFDDRWKLLFFSQAFLLPQSTRANRIANTKPTDQNTNKQQPPWASSASTPTSTNSKPLAVRA